MKSLSAVSDSLPALRWAFLALLTAAVLWLGLAVLPARAAWVNGGVLFAAYLCLGGCLLVAAGAWVRGSLRGLSWPVLLLFPLCAWIFYRVAVVSSESLVNLGAIPYFAAGTLLCALITVRETRPAPAAPPEPRLWALGLALGGCCLGAGVILLRQWSLWNLEWPADRTSLGLLLVGRVGGWANGISGTAFVQQAGLLGVAAWAVLLAALLAWRGRLGEKGMVAALFALALLGKLALEGLSSQGLGIIPLKIESVNTNYFTYAGTLGNPIAFLADFNALQVNAGPHVDVHPPMAVLIYWLLRLLLFSNSTLVALAVMALSAAAVWPLYKLGRGLGGPDLGLACAGLFLTSPLSLILGNAGIDSIVFTLVAFSAWFLWEATRQGEWKWGAASGAVLGLASLNSFGAITGLVFLGTWGLMLLWRRGGGLEAFSRRNLALWGGFSAALLAVHLAVWLLSGCRFNYWAAMSTAKAVHTAMNEFRPYELWSWGNVLLYAPYAGAGLAALWIARVVGSLFKADSSDALTVVSAAGIIGMVLQAYGRGEVQREYLFGAVFLLPVAAAALPRGRDGRLQAPALAVALGLNVLSAVLLQVYVLDYW